MICNVMAAKLNGSFVTDGRTRFNILAYDKWSQPVVNRELDKRTRQHSHSYGIVPIASPNAPGMNRHMTAGGELQEKNLTAGALVQLERMVRGIKFTIAERSERPEPNDSKLYNLIQPIVFRRLHGVSIAHNS
jgi:hypothetical protein